MSSARDAKGGRRTAVHGGARLPWRDILLAGTVSVGWALVGMAATAALGLHLLEADSAGSLGPMTAAVVALGAGGSVKPSGDVSAFGLKGAEAHTAIQITPLGVSLVGALLLSWFFLRSLRTAGVVIAPAELLARAGTVVALFTAMLGGLAWAGHDVVTIDGARLGLDRLPGGSGAGSGGVKIPGLGDLGNLGDLGGLLPDRIGKLVDAKAAVGFTVETAPTLLGGFGWAVGVLVVALLASRRTPLPAGWEAVHRVVRPAVSALVAVLLLVVAAGLAAAAYAAVGDDRPQRIAGAALLGAPNGTWLGLPLGLFVPWDGSATGVLTHFLPAPLDKLLGTHPGGQPVTVGRLADLDGRVWLLAAAAATAMLLAGVLTAVRTPVESHAGGVREPSALGFAGRCALRLGVVTALALPLLVRLTDVSVAASLSVLGFDAFGAGIELHGRPGTALLLGAVWGAGAGAAGALAAWATGAAGRRAAPSARGGGGGAGGPGDGREEAGAEVAPWSSPYAPHREPPMPSAPPVHGGGQPVQGGQPVHGGGQPVQGGQPVHGGEPRPAESGPYVPGTPYRPPNPDTNPYLRVPDEVRQWPPVEDAPPAQDRRPTGPTPPADVSGAPTVIGSFPDPSPPRRRPPGDRARSLGGSQDGPPPPPPPPPPAAPPRKPKRRP